MAVAILAHDLETYAGQYGTHGAIQRLQFMASTTDRKNLKVDVLRLTLDLLKRTTNTKGYAETHATLKDLAEAEDIQSPYYDSVWVEATSKQASILKDVYEQDLQQAKVTQIKDTIQNCHTQASNFYTEQGDYASALKHVTKSREYCTDPRTVVMTCLSIIKLSSLLRQHSDMSSIASKAQHTSFKDESTSNPSKIAATFGLYYMTHGNYKDAAFSFARVKPQDLDSSFNDVLCGQDVTVYGVLCALASLERNEVQSKLMQSLSFKECLELVPSMRDLALDFCNCRFAKCLSALEQLRGNLALDVHLSAHVNDICQQIRNKGMILYFAPFLSVSLRSMAEAFNTDVDGIQSEVAQLVGKRQLDAKIDSQKKVLHVRHSNQRKQTYNNAIRVSQDFLDTTQALILRTNLLKRDFGVHLVRQKKP
jgi:COP9 signalosome complex subunit 1